MSAQTIATPTVEKKETKEKKARKARTNQLGPVIEGSGAGKRVCKPVERPGMVKTVPIVRKSKPKTEAKSESAKVEATKTEPAKTAAA